MTRWKITLEYAGTNYAGWQRQDDLPTVQDSVQKAIYGFCQQEIAITGASRTDSGVHALGQIAHFDLDYGDRALSEFDLMKAINAHLRPQPISVIKAEKVNEDFHARFSAHQKLYTYRLINRHSFLTLDQDRAWLVMAPLDGKAMQEACAYLIGEHDFTSFRDAECQAKSPIRSIDNLSLEINPLEGGRGTEMVLSIEGQAFLHHMVRNIMGTLVLVGKGKLKPEDMTRILQAKDRSKAGMTAPAEGLTLVKIDY
ncbi:MAG: tRNA pseudouridine(38-40) synthase TruA [Pseudomonadota bacterium]